MQKKDATYGHEPRDDCHQEVDVHVRVVMLSNIEYVEQRINSLMNKDHLRCIGGALGDSYTP